MAAKNLREAILTGLTVNEVFLSEYQIRRLEGELRDFFAHEIARAVGKPPVKGTVYEKEVWYQHESHLSRLFHRIFEGVSAYQRTGDVDR